MKKVLSLILVFIMPLTLMLVGCSKPESGAASDSADKVYTLKVNTHCPETIPPGMITQMAADKAAELSNGRLKFEVYFSGNMVAYDDTFIGTADKVVDIAMVDASMIAQSFVVNQVFSKPLKVTPPARQKTTNAYREFLNNNPDLNKEFESVGVRWLSVSALAGYNIHTKDKEIKTPEDLKGLKLESIGDAVSYFTTMGSAATAMDPGEYYTSLEKNMIDGQATHWAVLNNFATLDFEKYHTIFGELGEDGDGGLYAPSIGFIINSQTWESLPADLQDILVESFSYGLDEMASMDIPIIEEAKKICTDRGDTFVYVKGDDLKPWHDWMDVSNKEWFDACKKLGYDGEALYNDLCEAIKAQW
jgi:TRAP-type C4-dicarboxylate transport system substrate-binding protein